MTGKKTILITGSTGFVGQYLMDYFKDKVNLIGLARSSADINCDLKNFENTKKNIKKYKPDIIIHTAGLVDVDICEKCPDKAYEENVLTTKNLLRCIDKSTKFIFLSTIAVYPNTRGPHKEEKINPVNYYGLTKLEAEKNVEKHKNYIILRSVFFGFSKNKKRITLCDHLLNNLKEELFLKLYQDEFFAPVHATTLANIINGLIDCKVTGTYNVATRRGQSKKKFGIYFAKMFGYSKKRLLFIDSVNDKNRVTRALDSRLNPKKLEKVLNIKMPSLYDEMKKLL